MMNIKKSVKIIIASMGFTAIINAPLLLESLPKAHKHQTTTVLF
ncbi:MAG: hypothetical protein ACJAUT_000344 [Cellvibrionaceae bacterium]|jgi:hypothetical protein